MSLPGRSGLGRSTITIWEKREGAPPKNSRSLRQPSEAQTARKTGPVIRMATAMERAKNVMAALLAETRPGIKGFRTLPFVPFAHILVGKWRKDGFMATSARAVKQEHQLTVSLDKVDRLRQWGFSNEEIHQIVGPRRSLDRRRAQGGVLSLIESDRVFRLEQIAEHADRVFGNHEKAQRWLRKPNRALDMVRPIDLLVSEAGAHQVHEILHRIDFGMFS